MFKIIVSLVLLVSVSGCSQLVSKKSGHNAISSSLVDFLYPDKDARVKHHEETPVLNLPVKVGIAFIPSNNWGGNVSEINKLKLLNKVKSSFGKHRFIESITIIPSVYLRQSNGRGMNGFDTLDRMARLHDIDVMALVSYDQVTQSRQNNASLLYWTIVGLYVIPGNENSIQTFVDTAVFDVRSRKMLLRAPGVSSLTKRSTAIGVDSVMTQKSLQGFNVAFDDMIKNLDVELTRFKARAKEGKSRVRIKHQPNYAAGGGFSIFFLIILLCLAVKQRLISTALLYKSVVKL